MSTEDRLFDALKYRVEKDRDGTTRYYNLDNAIHREGGPAIIHTNGDQYWAQNGKSHRLDGPAIIAFGNREWWIDGRQFTEEQFNELTKSTTI